ncbi:uncharacterized protein LOC119662557 [Teleopsis dalmanni]|uniref:uncharacterized protein LOC119662557 n=1 Tax=Teleopsis dalmanni TaxID=139649 RepID=UPI0018CC9E04|nr:uncharacterized protein LOC119662557 [Teleopsis dalmanni]
MKRQLHAGTESIYSQFLRMAKSNQTLRTVFLLTIGITMHLLKSVLLYATVLVTFSLITVPLHPRAGRLVYYIIHGLILMAELFMSELFMYICWIKCGTALYYLLYAFNTEYAFRPVRFLFTLLICGTLMYIVAFGKKMFIHFGREEDGIQMRGGLRAVKAKTQIPLRKRGRPRKNQQN